MRRPRSSLVVSLLLVSSTVAFVGGTLRTGTDERQPIDVSAAGARLTTLDELRARLMATDPVRGTD